MQKFLDDHSVEHKCLGIIKGDFVKKYPKGTAVKAFSATRRFRA